MKIFSRGTEPAQHATPPTTAVPTASAPKVASTNSPAPATQVPPSVPAAVATPVAPPNPELTAIIEANVKEMSEKIARLASTLEGDHSERADFESKLEKMEDRMRKLSSLTEMISAQYNPFVGAAPSERETLPAPDVGLAMPPLAMPLMAAQEAGEHLPQLVVDPAPPLADATLGGDAAPALAPVADDLGTLPAEDAIAGASDEEHPNGVRLWNVRPSFGGSMLMLNWADMLLKHAPGREGVERMLEYYCNVGWLGEPARDQLLAYVDGIAPASEASDRDWRAGVEVHEKSLLFIEKLRAMRAD